MFYPRGLQVADAVAELREWAPFVDDARLGTIRKVNLIHQTEPG